MKILHKGKTKEFRDNWYWRCSHCHTVGYHETEDGYTEYSAEGDYGFRCPICGNQIRANRPLNGFIAWLLYITLYKRRKNE